MRGFKRFCSNPIVLASALLALGAVGALAPAANAQVVIGVGIQPVCSYGYYDYAPYACAPVGFYGSGYFYNGIFLGMGPWAGWGYDHGWGGHRFVNDGGGRYHGGGGRAAGRAYARGEHAGNAQPVRQDNHAAHANEASHAGGERPQAGRPAPHAEASHSAPRAEASHSAPRAEASHSAPRAEASHSAAPRGASAHGGGESHGGGAARSGDHK
jgi:hypothetical protein